MIFHKYGYRVTFNDSSSSLQIPRVFLSLFLSLFPYKSAEENSKLTRQCEPRKIIFPKIDKTQTILRSIPDIAILLWSKSEFFSPLIAVSLNLELGI